MLHLLIGTEQIDEALYLKGDTTSDPVDTFHINIMRLIHHTLTVSYLIRMQLQP